MSRATLRTTHDDARIVAAALAVDNTDEMRTIAADGAVETSIERPTAAGLRTTVDDYLVCCSAATAVAAETTGTNDDANQRTQSDHTDRPTDDRSNTNQ